MSHRPNRHPSKLLCVVLTVSLCGGQASPLLAGQTSDRPPEGSEQPLRQEPVRVNRTRPQVAPPRQELVFSHPPSDREITAARVLPEPLIPLGGEFNAVENAALGEALQRFQRGRKAEHYAPLLDFLAKYRTSRWRASLLANLGTVYFRIGALSRALSTWEDAWLTARYAPDAAGRNVGHAAVAAWLDLASKLGRTEAVKARLKELEGRSIGGSAGQQISAAKEGLWVLENRHHEAFSSGGLALQALFFGLNGATATPPPSLYVHPDADGVTLAELEAAALAGGLDLQMVRSRVGDLPVPSVAHMRIGHYTAIVSKARGEYLLQDPLFPHGRWVSATVLEEELSGYFLVRRNSQSAVAEAVSHEQARRVVGFCVPGLPDGDEPSPGTSGNDNGGDDNGAAGNGGNGGDGSGGDGSGGNDGGAGGGKGPGCEKGMPTYTFHPSQTALVITDTPLGCTAPVGPATAFTLAYNHRSIILPSTLGFSNVGPQWSHDWLAFVADDPGSSEYQSVAVTLRGSGREWYGTPNMSFVYPTNKRSRATLVKTSTSPIRYERRLRDGSVEVYAVPDGDAIVGRRVFLSEVIDPQGQSLSFTYDANVRLVAVTDAIGRVTTLSYEHPTDPLKITKVTDPFGRFATLTYTAAGQLASITDVIGLTSSLTYAPDDFVAALTTPYGTTAFRREADPWMNKFQRLIEATDPLGATERQEWRWEHEGMAATEPSAEVPTGFETQNANLDHYNVFYWTKRAMAAGPTDANATITKLLLGHPLLSIGYLATGTPHSIKRPLERRVWFLYPDQPAGTEIAGSWTQPTRVGRVLDDGSSQIYEATYNSRGRTTSSTDPLGRRTTFVYASNDIDLVEVRQTTGSQNDLLASYGNYNVLHRPGTMTDAAGQTTTFTYNAAGQVLTATNPKNETTTFAYNTEGFLQGVTGAVAGATTSFTYDAFGRVRTTTDSDGYVLTTDYDALDRVTRVTYPDGTYDEVRYSKLDPTVHRDRAGRLTRSLYDPLRRLTAVRDPLGRTTSLQWCSCASLDKLIDARGNATSWERDVRNRVTREVRADGETATKYTYEAASGRLKGVTDPKQQVTTYTYALDGALLSTVYTNASLATPSVNLTYDTSFGRVATMSDGTGTTTYAYHPAGTSGAGAVASVDGPSADDTITYAYDELGRLLTRAVNGVAQTYTYDPLGRVTALSSVVGTFTYTYDGVSRRVAMLTYPNDQTTTYAYLSTLEDLRLQTIHHKLPTGATLAKFDYSYDPVGNVKTWRKELSPGQAYVWAYDYDAADQLINAVKSSTATPATILARFAYAYDQVGNRTVTQIDDAVTLSTYDQLNRIVTQQSGGGVRVVGTVDEPAAVTVNGLSARVDAVGQFVGAAQTVTGTNTFTVAATDANGNSIARTYQVAQSGSLRSFIYDANGNLLSDGTQSLEWYADNRLHRSTVGSVEQGRFTYDGIGRRASKLASGVNVSYLHSGPVLVRASEGTNLETYVDGITLDAHLGIKQPDGGVRYLAADHLGSVSAISSSSGVPLATTEFGPFGEPGAPALSEKFGFAGRQFDAEMGLYYLRNRYYAPQIGRFVSQDPIGLAGGVNLYAYVSNRSLNRVDPFGLDIVVIENGPTEGNPFGHTAIGITGFGMISYGNSTPLGSSIEGYLKREAPRRNTMVYVVKTSKKQDAAAIAAAVPDRNLGILRDNCSSRSNDILNAAGVGSSPCPTCISGDFPPIPLPNVPGSAGTRVGGLASEVYRVPKGTVTLPSGLLKLIQ